MVGPQKAKPAALRSFDSFRESSVSARTWARLGRPLRGAPRQPALHRPPVHEPPQETRKALALLDGEPRSRARDRALDLGAVPHDAGIAHQGFDPRGVEAGDRRRIEAREGAAEVLALAQDGDPGQPGLKAVEHQLFVEGAAV